MADMRFRVKHTKSQGHVSAPGNFSLWFWMVRGLLLIVAVLGLALPAPTSAQAEDGLIVLPPDCSAFPLLTTQVKPMPGFIAGAAQVGVDDLTVLENGQVAPVVACEQQNAGVHFTLAINGDRRFDLRDAEGVSPFDRIRLVLTEWVDGHRMAPGDTLTLVTHEGDHVRNAASQAPWVEALEGYQPDFRTLTPNLASLESALRLSEERVVPFGVDKLVLYITPPPEPEEIAPLITLAESARLAGIRVHVWMLGEEHYLANDQGGALINLAERTGGQFFLYTGIEALPDPESYLDGLGMYYDLRYESRIRAEGTYVVSVTISTDSGELRGESGEFYLNVQPPKPILLSPPSGIERVAPQGWEGNPEDLMPDQMDIEFILEFPDQYPRELTVSRLYVDDRLVDQRSETPFEKLTWDLGGLVEPGEHVLQVAVEDVLGLSGETILLPIQVAVSLPEPEPRVSDEQIGLAVVIVILAAAGVLLAFWLARHGLQTAFAQRLARKIFDARSRPVSPGSVVPAQEDSIYATLLPLEAGGTDVIGGAVRITRRNTSFGCDPDRANQVLMGAQIDGLHARLRAKEDEFWLTDSGSVAGTWVNYAPISRDPVQIFPGDIIHFGPVGFRFTIIGSDSPPKATVSKYEPIL
jgi:hypothetical protein